MIGQPCALGLALRPPAPLPDRGQDAVELRAPALGLRSLLVLIQRALRGLLRPGIGNAFHVYRYMRSQRLVRGAHGSQVAAVALTVRDAGPHMRKERICTDGTMANKVYKDAKSALDGLLRDDLMLMCGGFGLVGIPDKLIHAVRDSGVKGLTCVSNNAGIDGAGLGLLLETGQVKKMISSYVGENKTFAKLYLEGKLELEFNPQGTLAERVRAGGAGIPAFYTKTGVGTLVAEGKETKVFDGEEYVMERGLVGDIALVKAWKGDTAGNLVFRKAARNFNPMMATAARVCVAEVEELVPVGQIDPDDVHTPAVFVQRILCGAPYDKKIEQRTVRKA